MHVREGMRRLAILLGIWGAFLGGFVAYGDAKSVWNSYAASRWFESVMASPTMRKVAQAALDHQRKYCKNPWAKYRVTSGQLTYADGAIWVDVPASSLEGDGRTKNEFGDTQVEPPTRKRESRDIWDQAADSCMPDQAVGTILISVNLQGVREVAADKAGIISSIELTTGEIVQRTAAPPNRILSAAASIRVSGLSCHGVPFGCLPG
jgi:hypothetical protein